MVIGQAALEFPPQFQLIDLVPEVTGEGLQALVDVEDLQQALPQAGVVAEIRSGEVHKRLRVFHGAEKLRQLRGDVGAQASLGVDQRREAVAQRLVFLRVGARTAAQCPHANAAVGFLAGDAQDGDA